MASNNGAQTSTPAAPTRTTGSSEDQSRAKRWKIIADRIGPDYAAGNIEQWVYHGPNQDQQRDVLKEFKSYCDEMRQDVALGTGLTLFGPKGTGKDFLLSIALRRAVLDHGMFARWFNGMDLYVQMRAGMSNSGDVSEAYLIQQLSTVPILAISDPLPPFGNLTEFQAATLFTILDARYRAKFPTWMTINVLNRKDAADRMGSQIIDRIAHRSVRLFCNWGSYREHERGL